MRQLRSFTALLVVLLLAVNQLSATHHSSAAEMPDSFTARLQLVLDEGARYEEELRLEARRAISPGTPGTPDGRLTLSGLEQLDARVTAWKTFVEELLTHPAQPAANEDQLFDRQSEKWKAIRAYFSVLNTLATLNAALRPGFPLARGANTQSCAKRPRYLDENWIRAHALMIPAEISELFPYEVRTYRDRTGESYLPIVVENIPGDSGNWMRLRPSAAFLRGIELSALSQQPNEKNHLALRKFVALHRLMLRLRELKYLKRDRSVGAPSFKPEILTQLETLCLTPLIEAEQDRVDEPSFRVALLETFGQSDARFPSYVTPELARELGSILSHAPNEAFRVHGPMLEMLLAAEKLYAPESLANEIASSVVPFSTRSTDELYQGLRIVVAATKAHAVLQKLSELLDGATFQDFSTEQRAHVMRALRARQTEYFAELDAPQGGEALQAWLGAAHATDKTQYFDLKRQEFIERMLYNAPEAAEHLDQLYSGQLIDTTALLKSIVPALSELPMSPEADQWIGDIQSKTSYMAARAAYADQVVKLTAPAAAPGGIVDPVKAAKLARQHKAQPLPLTSNTDPALAKRENTRAAQMEIADRESLLKFGELMGFHRLYPSSTPNIREVLADPEKEKIYFQILSHEIETARPILGVTVQRTLPRASRPQSLRLADALVAINPHRVARDSVIKEATPLIDQALAQIETQLLENIKEVSGARRVEDIRRILSSSIMASAFLDRFPEYEALEQKIDERLAGLGTLDRILDEVHPVIFNVFMADMAIRGTHFLADKWIHRALPITSVFSEGFDAMFSGLLRGAMVFLVANDAYELSKSWMGRTDLKQQRDFLYCGADGPCLTDAAFAAEMTDQYSSLRNQRLANFALNGVLMYGPWLRGVTGGRASREIMREVEADVALQTNLGTKPGDFDLGERMRAARDIRQGVPANAQSSNPALRAELEPTISRLSAEEWEQMQARYVSVLKRQGARELYRFTPLLDRIAIEDAFATLGLNPKITPKSNPWQKIEEARAFREHAAPNGQIAARINQAARFLETYKKSVPAVETSPFEFVSKAERRVFVALRRSAVGQFWTEFLLKHATDVVETGAVQ